jgi:hypothetical protein
MKDGNMFRITSSYAAVVMFIVLTAAQIGNNVGKYKFVYRFLFWISKAARSRGNSPANDTTNSTVSSSWQDDSCLDNQEVLRSFWSSVFYYHVRNRPQLIHILSQFHPLRFLPNFFFNIQFSFYKRHVIAVVLYCCMLVKIINPKYSCFLHEIRYFSLPVPHF